MQGGGGVKYPTAKISCCLPKSFYLSLLHKVRPYIMTKVGTYENIFNFSAIKALFQPLSCQTQPPWSYLFFFRHKVRSYGGTCKNVKHIFSHGACSISVRPLLCQPQVFLLLCWKDPEGPGKIKRTFKSTVAISEISLKTEMPGTFQINVY